MRQPRRLKISTTNSMPEIPVFVDDVYVPPKNCVELIIYDNDGPEGCFERKHFSRSSEAVAYIIKEYGNALDGWNFEITNHYQKS